MQTSINYFPTPAAAFEYTALPSSPLWGGWDSFFGRYGHCRHDNPDFYGATRYNPENTLVPYGEGYATATPPATIAKQAEKNRALFEELDASAPARRLGWKKSEEGQAFSPSRFSDFWTGGGSARFFNRCKRREVETRRASIVFECTLHCKKKAVDFERRAAAILSCVQALEDCGIATRLVMASCVGFKSFSSARTMGARTLDLTECKGFGEYADIARLWGIVRPEFSRRVMHLAHAKSAAFLKMPRVANEGLGHCVGIIDGGNSACFTRGEVADAIGAEAGERVCIIPFFVDAVEIPARLIREIKRGAQPESAVA